MPRNMQEVLPSIANGRRRSVVLRVAIPISSVLHREPPYISLQSGSQVYLKVLRIYPNGRWVLETDPMSTGDLFLTDTQA